MKKITAAQRVAEIFTSEPLDACDVLLDVAQSIVKQRRGVAPKKARKSRGDLGHKPATTNLDLVEVS